MNYDRRLVINTGVLVSAAIQPKSIPALALEKAFLFFGVCASDETIAELLAESADAELIIASDPHLTNMHPWRGIPIMPPAAFLVGIR
jgi:predicted nucleic acid-binding protein